MPQYEVNGTVIMTLLVSMEVTAKNEEEAALSAYVLGNKELAGLKIEWTSTRISVNDEEKTYQVEDCNEL